MKLSKLILGILSVVFSIMVLFQSCAASVGDALQAEGGFSGAIGTIVAILMLAGGIVCIAGRASKGAAIANVVIFGLAGLIGVTSTGIFSDLKIWGVWCLIVFFVNLISLFVQFKKPDGEK